MPVPSSIVTPSRISSAVGSGVGDGVGSGAAVGSGVAVGAAVASGVGAGLGLGDRPQAVRSAHASANIRRSEIERFVADVRSPAVEAGGFGNIIGRFAVRRQEIPGGAEPLPYRLSRSFL